MFSYGIMQGRLTPSQGRGIQFFPFDNWEREFYDAAELGLQEIEWIFDYENYKENPLWYSEGCDEIRKVIQSTGVVVRSICFDYFMRRPFHQYTADEKNEVYKENVEIFKKIIDHSKTIGARLIEVPLVDASSVKNLKEEDEIVEYLNQVSVYAKERGITIGIESDYTPENFPIFLSRFTSGNIVANYDSGNSSGLGYDSEKEILGLENHLFNVHIKDRIKGGTTVELGTGSADFDKVFRSLKEVGYQNSIILQAARGDDGLEKETIADQLVFVKSYIEKYYS